MTVCSRGSLCFPAVLHLICIELCVLPVFEFAVFSFLRDTCVDISTFSWGGMCEACAAAAAAGDAGSNFLSSKAFYGALLWQAPFRGIDPATYDPTYDSSSGMYVDSLVWIPIFVFHISLLLVGLLWLGTVVMFFVKVGSVLTPTGSGKYLKFLWQNRTSLWYSRMAKLLEVGAVCAIIILLGAAFAFRGIDALRWALETKLLDGIVIVISMRQFTRPQVPLFNFKLEDFDKIRFKVGIFSNSSAVINILHGEFCQAFAADLAVVSTEDEVKAVRSMLMAPEGKEGQMTVVVPISVSKVQLGKATTDCSRC